MKHERKNLLQHPLISCYIAHKWWMLSPAFFLYLFTYGMFLILLTSFSLIIPRPGPDDQYCELCQRIAVVCTITLGFIFYCRPKQHLRIYPYQLDVHRYMLVYYFMFELCGSTQCKRVHDQCQWCINFYYVTFSFPLDGQCNGKHMSTPLC